MADRIEARISCTPIVTLPAGSDSDAVDVLHHDIKSTLGGDYSYTFNADNWPSRDPKWYWAPNIIAIHLNRNLLHNPGVGTELVGASGDPVNGPNEAAGVDVHYTDGEVMDSINDSIRFMFIKNTGTSDINGTPTTNSIYINQLML